MSKISEFIEKTALEVEDTDILAIEDLEDTKKITIETLKEVLRPMYEDSIKVVINETLDRISEAILNSKWDLTNYIVHRYNLNTWIGSASGNIQIAVLDNETNKWLTREELEELFTDTAERTHKIQVMINHTWEEPVSMRILDFNEEHEMAEEINKWMSDDNAGFLKIHFDDLEQNEIARIIYEDIKIEIETTEENTSYIFTVSRDSFANAVPYIANVPTYCPCCHHNHEHYDHNQPEKPTEPEQPVEPQPPAEDDKDDEVADIPVGDDLIDDSFTDTETEETDGDE